MEPLVVAEDEVHVWRAPLDLGAEDVARWSRLLDERELSAAARKRFERDRHATILSHGALRAVLARYCGAEPHALRFRFGENGKPALDGGGDGVSFNLSHARGLALLGVARGREIGVDVEHESRLKLEEGLAQRVLTERELAIWRAAPDARRAAVFLRAWTCKEAVVKASGRGLSMDPRGFDALSSEAEDGYLRDVRDAEGVTWTVRTIDAGGGYHAAIAAAGAIENVRAFDVPGHWAE